MESTPPCGVIYVVMWVLASLADRVLCFTLPKTTNIFAAGLQIVSNKKIISIEQLNALPIYVAKIMLFKDY